MDELQTITKKLKKMKSVKVAILFGSYAKGKQRKDSDVDICVITDSIEDRALELSSDIFDISLFHKLPLIVRYRVFKDGKILFSKDDKLLTKLKFWTVKLYLDEKYWRDRAVAKVLA
ncbi:nucleotidyltransferase domain-containing protein [Candidatus Micrarchaeota archaeon]|nr:nucleotidyltransferase domain-containing protein [Candidatus Micrarchaeota archaeon]